MPSPAPATLNATAGFPPVKVLTVQQGQTTSSITQQNLAVTVTTSTAGVKVVAT